MSALNEAITYLSKGFHVGKINVSADIHRGRFPEERNLIVYASKGRFKDTIAYVKIFYGRPPYYKAWVEIFNIKPVISLDSPIKFFDSPLEEILLDIFSESLKGGERLFVEYVSDEVTLKQLLLGFPPPVTRLGYKLYERGFTWFKDWYFPEGFMEGSLKLQAEKPLNEEWFKRNLNELLREVKDLLRRYKRREILELKYYELEALANAKKILEKQL